MSDEIDATLRKCCLCGEDSTLQAMFFPKDPKEFGVGMVLYGLCESCFRLPDKAALVEEEILRKFRPQ